MRGEDSLASKGECGGTFRFKRRVAMDGSPGAVKAGGVVKPIEEGASGLFPGMSHSKFADGPSLSGIWVELRPWDARAGKRTGTWVTVSIRGGPRFSAIGVEDGAVAGVIGSGVLGA
jgi:hypothetical protein